MIKTQAGHNAQELRPLEEAEGLIAGFSSRAVRYELCTRIRFRVSGEDQWREGEIKNISGSGVLFNANCLIEPSTPVEMSFAFAELLEVANSAEAFCRGVVVRASMCAKEPGAVLLATTIAFARISRQRTQEERLEDSKRSRSSRSPRR